MNAYGTSLGGIPANTEPFVPLVSLVEHVAWDDAPALEKVIETVGARRVAAFFCEPVVGAGGVYPPPEGYLASVREICRRHDVLFIADEVITGFGRTGSWLASERFALDPDMITTAKGLSSGYAPIGAVIASARVAEPFWRPGSAEVFRHGYTYSAHPTACAVASANLDLIEREQLVARVARLEPVLARALAPLAGHDLVGEVRAGTGLLAAVEIAEAARRTDPGIGPRLVAEIRERGVITRLLRGVALQVSPAVRDHRGGDRPDRRGLRRGAGRRGRPDGPLARRPFVVVATTTTQECRGCHNDDNPPDVQPEQQVGHCLLAGATRGLLAGATRARPPPGTA